MYKVPHVVIRGMLLPIIVDDMQNSPFHMTVKKDPMTARNKWPCNAARAQCSKRLICVKPWNHAVARAAGIQK
jgi:hypothetical protein